MAKFHKKVVNLCGNAPTVRNFVDILTKDPDFPLLGCNTCSGQYAVSHDGGKTWAQLTTDEICSIILMLYDKYGVDTSSKNAKLQNAIVLACNQKKFDPLQLALESLSWDGKARAEESLIKWLGAEDTAYNRLVSRTIYTMMANRVMKPGCKLDAMPCLIGRPGIGKTLFTESLASFTENGFIVTPAKVESPEQRKVAAEMLRNGCVVAEVREAEAIIKSSGSAVKSFFSENFDVYRRLYTMDELRIDRRNVFVVTANISGLIEDETACRRFLPVFLNRAGDENGRYVFEHRKELDEWNMQCLAEALVHFRDGSWEIEPPVEMMDEVREAQKQILVADETGSIMEQVRTTLDALRKEGGIERVTPRMIYDCITEEPVPEGQSIPKKANRDITDALNLMYGWKYIGKAYVPQLRGSVRSVWEYTAC